MSDPALTAAQQWQTAFRAYNDALHCRAKEAEIRKLQRAEHAALKAACRTVATSVEGLAAQMAVALEMFGTLEVDGDPDNPEDYRFGQWSGDLDGHLARNLLAGARAIAERDSSLTRPEPDNQNRGEPSIPEVNAEETLASVFHDAVMLKSTLSGMRQLHFAYSHSTMARGENADPDVEDFGSAIERIAETCVRMAQKICDDLERLR